MATQPQINVKISAKADELSASLAKVRKEIAGLPALAQQASRKTGSMDLFGSSKSNAGMFGLDKFERQISRVNGLARTGLGGLGRAGSMIPGIGALAGAASVAGIGDMMSSSAAAGVQLKNTALLAGTSAAGLNSLRGAARMMGLSAGDADGAMTGLNHAIQDAVFGKNAEAASYFRLAGIDIGSIATGAKSAESILPKVVDNLTKAAKANPLAAESLAKAWYIPSGALPLLTRGQEALQAYRTEIEKVYGSFDAYLRASEAYAAAINRMSLSSEKLGNTVMTSLAPALSPMLLDLAKWVDRHNKDISDTFDRIGKSIAGIHWSEVGADIDKVGRFLAVAGDRAGIFATNMTRVYNAVTAPGRAFQDWYQGRGPTDSGVDVQMSPRQRELLYQGGTAQMRAGTLPGPEEGMSLPPAGAGGSKLSAAEQERQARASREQFIGMGWSPQAAAGIVANLYSESGMDPRAVGDGLQAGGRAQWHNTRRQAIRRHFGKSIESMSGEEQNVAVDWELRGPEKAAGDALRQAKTAAEAGDIVSRQYERPRAVDAEASARARFADAFDRRWSSGPPRSPQLTMPEAAPSAANSGNSTVRIQIDHSNVPAGVTMTPSVQGSGAELGGIRVRRAMPEAGAAAFGGT